MESALKFAMMVMDLVPLVVKGVTGAAEAFQAGRDAVKLMVDEDRDPTDEEWAALNADLDEMQRKLHSDTE